MKRNGKFNLNSSNSEFNYEWKEFYIMIWIAFLRPYKQRDNIKIQEFIGVGLIGDHYGSREQKNTGSSRMACYWRG